MEPIYCISGMGADERIFSKLELPGYKLMPLKWAQIGSNENMSSYAGKLAEQIPGEKPLILGLSFGGMLAVEIGKLRVTKKIVLVSSAKTTSELPRIGRTSYAGRLIDLIPATLFTASDKYSFNLAGGRTADELNLLSSMMRNTPPGFIKQALKIVTGWNNSVYPDNLLQIHGTKDWIIPPSNVHPDHWIQGGSHIMIYNRAAEISRIIKDCLNRFA
jgi:pimeloyl-ACP methyl ester carboxylesterase